MPNTIKKKVKREFALPDMIWIATQPWSVRQTPESDEILAGMKRMGDMDPNSNDIRVKKAGVPPSVQMVTLWHEIIHAILFNSGFLHTFLKDEAQEEALVQMLGTAVYQVLVENEWWVIKE